MTDQVYQLLVKIVYIEWEIRLGKKKCGHFTFFFLGIYEIIHVHYLYFK